MLYLSYSNTEHTDGAGAQMMRILGIYAIAMKYNCAYLRSPMLKIEHCPDNETKERWNSLCDAMTPNSVKTRPTLPVVNIQKVTESDITGRDNVILQILYPFLIVDKTPDILYNVKYKTEPLHGVATLHIRRGDAKAELFRMLPDVYYRCIVCSIKKEKPDIQFHVYSDEPVTLGDDCVYFVNTDPLESIHGLSRGEFLVMSKSGFSVIAAHMCAGTIIYPPEFWHSPMPHWEMGMNRI